MNLADVYFVNMHDSTNPQGQAIRAWHAMPATTFGQPPVIAPRQAPTPLVGKLTIGQAVELLAQLVAAFQPLPAAPSATNRPETDLGSLIQFQRALAQRARRDALVRAVGNLVARLVA